MLRRDKPVEYPFGTTVTLRRSRAASGFFWIGSCIGNRAGKLDAAACTIHLESSELVGAGFKSTGEIPPVKGSGIEVRLAGKGHGKLTGGLVNGGKRLTCAGVRCSITGLTRYDYVRLKGAGGGAQPLRSMERWAPGYRAGRRAGFDQPALGEIQQEELITRTATARAPAARARPRAGTHRSARTSRRVFPAITIRLPFGLNSAWMPFVGGSLDEYTLQLPVPEPRRRRLLCGDKHEVVRRGRPTPYR